MLNATSAPSLWFLGTAVDDVPTIRFRWSGAANDFADFNPQRVNPPKDLTDAGASTHLLFDFVLNDVPSAFQVTLHSWDGVNPVQSASATLDVPGAILDRSQTTTLGIPLNAFAGVDATKVTAVEITAAPAERSPGVRYRAWDPGLDNIRSGPAGDLDPTPSTPPAPALPPLVSQTNLPAHAVIDLFSATSGGTSLISSTGGGAAGVSNAQAIGGKSFHRFEPQAGSQGIGRFKFNSSQYPGDLLMTADAGLQIRSTFQYDGDDDNVFTPGGVGALAAGVDITGGGAFDSFWIGVNYSDVPSSILMEVRSGTGGSALSTALIDLPTWNFDGTTLVVPFSAFSGTADFADVRSLRYTIDGGTGGLDLQLSYIVTAAVPEPASVSALGLIASILLRRRAKG